MTHTVCQRLRNLGWKNPTLADLGISGPDTTAFERVWVSPYGAIYNYEDLPTESELDEWLTLPDQMRKMLD